MPNASLDLIRAANREMKRLLEADLSKDRDGVGRLVRLRGLFERIGEIPGASAASEQTTHSGRPIGLAEYRQNLEEIQGSLETLERRLRDRRRTLEAEQSRLGAARRWVDGYRKTL